MPLSSKTRTFQVKTPDVEVSANEGKTWFKTPGSEVNVGSQVTDSEGHPRLPNGNRSGGGPFYTSRKQRSFPVHAISVRGTNGELIRGSVGTPLIESTVPVQWRNKTPEQFRSKDTSGLDQYGATAIAQCAPINPNAELNVALSELYKERLPSLPGIQTWKRRTEILRAAASEFLNAEFGWLPLISDITDTANSVRLSREILKLYHRDSGRNVRREFTFPTSTSVSETNIGSYSPSTSPFIGGQWPPAFGIVLAAAPVTQTIKVSSRKWFSGAFTYTVPGQSDSWSNVERIGADADKLFGITLTPDVLWELTPWSWAVDWFTNTGDVIKNVNNFVLQGLVMRYGYMMEETSVEITNQLGKNPFNGTLDYAKIPPQTLTYNAKVRRPANPFGFGVSSGGLSATQIAIAAALGITLL